jgi:uncharacterized iron-regulated membrane protein
MKTFRKIIFWMHLTAGATAGVVIFVMCVTGALLSFERQIIEFSERDVREVNAGNDVPTLTPQQVLEKVREERPQAKPSAIARTNEPGAAWTVNLGREGQLYIDPHSGAVLGEGNKTVRNAMSELRNWHRYVALSGDSRPVGKAITGVSNLLFLFLAMSGIYIWFPRNLQWSAIKQVIWFRRGLRGKARNFNWHNTIGFWTSLFLIVFTVTAAVISYQWASNLLYTITGNEVPQQQQQQGVAQSADKPYEYPDNVDAAWAAAEIQAPTWRSISLRLPIEKESAVFTIDEGIYWNIFGRSTLTTDMNGGTAKWEPYGGQNSGRQLRSWFRFTHTGESFGIVGQIIGFIACVGGAFLVWTGFSLALRRFRNWRSAKSAA